MMETIREATHAGSWYSDKSQDLSRQLDDWLAQVPNTIPNVGSIPLPSARTIITPHAGYSYSGPAAAWAYKSLDLSRTKRVFLLGPSHHVYLNNCALSQCTHYRTPIGDLEVDTETVATLFETGKFGKMTKHVDEDEHSLEMQLPYIYKVLSRAFAPEDFPTLVPILVGSTSPEKERAYGALLAPYLEDETSIFVISSDFCHWGLRFGYTYYLPDPSSSSEDGIKLRAKEKTSGAAIYESIEAVDRQAMSCIESGSYDSYIANLQSTGNTVCGQHPIGVVMCALETLKSASKLGGSSTNFKFIRYERSSQCRKVSDSSVSYASAFAVVECKTTAGV